MSFRKAFVLVEGQTEETFVKEVLSEFTPEGLFLQPVIVATKRVNSGGKFKGGVPGYPRVRNEVMRLLGDSSAECVTTMLDYYALPSTFPGRGQPQGQTSIKRVLSVESAWNADISDSRFRAYLSLHEFEALLFSAPAAIAQGFAKPELEPALASIRSQFSTPEEINDRPETAPSARLQALYPRYSKPFFGTLIARRIGMETMMAQCPHFADWVHFLKTL
jgi:hypothetical protein